MNSITTRGRVKKKSVGLAFKNADVSGTKLSKIAIIEFLTEAEKLEEKFQEYVDSLGLNGTSEYLPKSTQQQGAVRGQKFDLPLPISETLEAPSHVQHSDDVDSLKEENELIDANEDRPICKWTIDERDTLRELLLRFGY